MCIFTTRHGVKTVSLSGFLKYENNFEISAALCVGARVSAYLTIFLIF